MDEWLPDISVFFRISQGVWVSVVFLCKNRNREWKLDNNDVEIICWPCRCVCEHLSLFPRRRIRIITDSLSFWNWKTDLPKRNSKNHLNSLMFWIYRFVWFLTKILTRRLVECVSLVNMNPQLLSLAQRLEKGRQPAWFSDLLASQLNNCLVFFSFV